MHPDMPAVTVLWMIKEENRDERTVLGLAQNFQECAAGWPVILNRSILREGVL